MGLFKKAKRSLGYEDAKLRERGVEGTAEVLSSEKTMMTEETGSGGNRHVYKHRLLVTVPGSEPYEVTYRRLGALPEGGEYRTFVDPKDSKNVFVDSAGMARERAADELSQLTGRQTGTDTGSILDATAGKLDDVQKHMFTAPPGAPTPAPAPHASTSSASQGEGYRMILISRLDARHDKGELSDEEYEAEKRKLQGGAD
jgi:putative oligomerization/nucleic acid binding protein